MAESLSHKFGQIIGELLELALEPHLRKFARKHKLYLDKKGSRKARQGKKVTWTDGHGNQHDLDFVLERGGTENKTGAPAAFIESAWRRYTKHSRNKAQEIQSAILPLANSYKNASPFIGVVLAGVFTEGALNQLKSLGFAILYFPYETVLRAFAKHGIDAGFDEKTSDAEFQEKIDSWNKSPNQNSIAKTLVQLNTAGVKQFLNALENSILRSIDRIMILPLYGKELVAHTITDALELLKNQTNSQIGAPFVKFEIVIRYNNGDRIEASFKNNEDAIHFLQTFSQT